MTDVSGELALREVVAETLIHQAAQVGYLKWADLQNVHLPAGWRHRRLVDPGRGGIWNPSDLVATLSIITSFDGPSQDQELENGLLLYSYQDGPTGGKNLKLRRAMELGLPLIRFNKVAKNAYDPIYPVFVVGDDPGARMFTLALDESLRMPNELSARDPIVKKYAEQLVRQRVHQRAFRAQILRAYESRCAVCVLRKVPLLDAAHIISDRDDLGDAVVSNGLSLCKIHHAAYDQNILGITPDSVAVVNESLLLEEDGPMLLHGLQEMHERRLVLPNARADRPDPKRLAVRFDEFLAS